MATTDKTKDQGAYGAGQTARAAIQATRGSPGIVGEITGVSPALRSAGAAVGSFTRGLVGAAPAVQRVPAQEAASRRQAPSPAGPPRPQGGQAPAAGVLPNAPADHVPHAPRPGDSQTFTAGGVTRQLPSYQPQANPTQQQRTLSQPTVAPRTPAPQNMGMAPQGGVIRNADEDRRRLQIALTTMGRGSPSVRRALMDQYGAQQQRQYEGHQAALNRTDAAARTMMEATTGANEAFADRRQAADQFNVATAAQQQQRDDGQRAIVRTLTDQQGNANTLRADGSLTSITDAAGNPVQEQAGVQQLAPNDLLKSYTDLRTSILEGLGSPEEKQAQLSALDADPMFAGLRRAGKVSDNQPPPAAIEELRANPAAAAQFDEIFGEGAAARHLGN